jgi:glyoxylase-like metal-dependent hydrolase (beta-lactamase superfamily II)
MIKEILDGIFQIEVPLPRNPLKVLNSYLFKGKEKSLLVDTGFNWPECKQAQVEGLAALGVGWSEVDFFITHVHGDHSGLVYDLACPDSRVYCSRTDAELIKASMDSAVWSQTDDFFIMNGFPEDMLKNKEEISKFISGSDLNYIYVKDGDIISIGDYNLVCIATPGHSPGHMCLYEPKQKFLISGDHILAGITSNITAWPAVDDSLGNYLASLDKVNAMDIGLVLPGHREIIYDHHLRIAQLKNHHEERLNEILKILEKGAMNAYQVASLMHWDLSYDSWDQFPDFQKWFATGEAIAHLDHLVQRKDILKIEEAQKRVYALSE